MSEDKVRYFAVGFLAAFLGNCTYDQCSPRSVEHAERVERQIEAVRGNVAGLRSMVDEMEPKVNTIERKVEIINNYVERTAANVYKIKNKCFKDEPE